MVKLVYAQAKLIPEVKITFVLKNRLTKKAKNSPLVLKSFWWHTRNTFLIRINYNYKSLSK